MTESFSVTDLAAALAGFLAVVISIISLGWSAINAMKSDQIAMQANQYAKEANDTANEALRISKFTYRKEICPELVVSMKCTIPYTYRLPYYIGVELKNIKWGEAKIVSFRTNVLMGRKLTYPDIPELDFTNLNVFLNLNGRMNFEMELDEKMVKEQLPRGQGIKPYTQEWLDQIYLMFKQAGNFTIEFQDLIGTTYDMTLRYDSEKDLFTGSPHLIHEAIVQFWNDKKLKHS